MIQIKPEIDHQIFCPKCEHKSAIKEIAIQSAFTLGECVCQNCGFEFYQTLPIGHTTTDILTITKPEGKLYPSDTKKTWLTEALMKAYREVKSESVHIKKVIFKKHPRVVILNALDYLYGHVLLKLYNSTHHLDHQKDLGLVVIIPAAFEWLVPQGCAEAWVVNLPLNDLVYNHSSVQKLISKEFERFETIFLSKGYSHPDVSHVDISRFTGIKAFDLKKFCSIRPTFTFVLREDRWWYNSRLDYWFYRACRKLNVLKIGSTVLSLRQNRLVKKTITRILKKLPGTNIYIVGLGKSGNFKGYAHDERKVTVDASIERDWCSIYAQSHVVIGVHGSNMLLPTAHSAGCVEILPHDRYGNIVQDISVRYNDRRQLYFYSFADQYARPEAIADKAISIVENFEIFEKNMCNNVYQSEQKYSHSYARVEQ